MVKPAFMVKGGGLRAAFKIYGWWLFFSCLIHSKIIAKTENALQLKIYNGDIIKPKKDLMKNHRQVDKNKNNNQIHKKKHSYVGVAT